MRLKDKVIIVTGGTSGIGAAIATAAIREGAKVLVHGINEEEGRATVDRLGANAVLCLADLADDSAPEVIVGAALKAFGKIDGIVNNAAIFGGTNISEQEIDHFRRMMQINLTAPLFLIKAAFEELKKSGGSVLNIGSINAHAGESKLLAYSISKGSADIDTHTYHRQSPVLDFAAIETWIMRGTKRILHTGPCACQGQMWPSNGAPNAKIQHLQRFNAHDMPDCDCLPAAHRFARYLLSR